MSHLLDLGYLLVLVLLSPYLVYKAARTGKYRRGLWAKITGRTRTLPRHDGPTVWFHGVSVGEVHLLRQVVAAFRASRSDARCVISTTTDTGFEEARKHFPDLEVRYWPLDFSWAVRGALSEVRPELVVLAESELWPNFLLAAERLSIPVAAINARMSPRSFARWSRSGRLAGWLFGKVALFAAQTDEYATNLRRLGSRNVVVTGSVKYDGVTADRENAKTMALRQLFQVTADDIVWVAGSTQAPEEETILEIFERLGGGVPDLRLFVVPRQRERFDEVSAMLDRAGMPYQRRSRMKGDEPACRLVLVDTIGELGPLWGLADVAFVGGSLDGRRGGQNMIEPAGFGAAVLFGPHVWNFRDTAARLVVAGALAVVVNDGAALEREVVRLLGDPLERARMGRSAREFVTSKQGATKASVGLLCAALPGQRLERKTA